MELLNVGKIVNTHGLKGEVKVVPITDFPKERFAPGSRLYFEDGTPVTVANSRVQKGNYLVSFSGFNDINKVEKYKGTQLRVAKGDLSPLEDGQYYYHQIIGLQVVDNEDKSLGEISEILSPGANDVWVVQRKDHSELLLPVIDDVVKEVDLDNQVVHVELLEGLE